LTRRILILAVAATLVVAGTALASTFKYGSDLKAPANLRETHPVDSAFWAKAFPDHRGVAAPAKGKVTTVKVKGTAIKQHGKTPNTLFHFQVLHPITGGKVKVKLTSGPFHVPVGGDPNRVTTYHPINLCVKKGDFVAFSDVGGFKKGSYPNGTPFQVFSSVVGSVTNHHIQSGGINNGSSFKGKAKSGEELLMRMILVTGKGAGICK
jgi:hypothetical protein